MRYAFVKASVLLFLEVMPERNHLALVPKLPSSLAKAEPGAKRILSGMVNDTLALAKRRSAKPLFSVQLGGFPDPEPIKRAVISALSSRFSLLFTHVKLSDLMHYEDLSDLILLDAANVDWKIDDCNCLSWLKYADSPFQLADGPIRTTRNVLAWLQAKHSKPVLALPGAGVGPELEPLGVTVLKGPFTAQAVRDALRLPTEPCPKETFSVTIWGYVLPDYLHKHLGAPLQEILGRDYSLVLHRWDYSGEDKLLGACGGFDMLVIFVPPNPPIGSRKGHVMVRLSPKDLISHYKSRYGKPIVVLNNCPDPHEQFRFAQWPEAGAADWCESGADAYFSWSAETRSFPIEPLHQALATCVAKSLGSRPSKGELLELSRKPLEIICLDDEPGVLDCLHLVLREIFPRSSITTFSSAESALMELERQNPVLFTTDYTHPGPRFPEILEMLAAKRGKYPILLITAAEGLQEMVKQRVAQGWRVMLLSKPFTVHDLRSALKKLGLLFHSEARQALEARATRGKACQLSIAVIDDEEWFVEMVSLALGDWYQDAVSLIPFADGIDAWRFLSATDPDLLIMGMMPIGLEILPKLAERKVQYPILATSGYIQEAEVRSIAGPELRLTFLAKPFEIQALRAAVGTALQMPGNRAP
jgi:CheY-like chemotaxis protein